MLIHDDVTTKPDGLDPTKVQPSWWNKEHRLNGGVDGQALVRDSTQSFGASWKTMIPAIPVASDAEIPNGQARLVLSGISPNRSLRLRYNENGTYHDVGDTW